MIPLSTDDLLLIGRDYDELVSPLLTHLRVRDDDDLAALAVACLGLHDRLEVVILHMDER